MSARIFVAPAIENGRAAAPLNLHRPKHPSCFKTGSQHQNVARVQRTVARNHAFGLYMMDLQIDQIDIGFRQHPVPMIIAQHAFAIGWIIRRRLTDKLWIMADFPRNMRFQLLAHFGIGCIQRVFLVRPVGIHLQIVMEGVR